MAIKVPSFPTSGQKVLTGDVEVDPFSNEATIVGGTVVEVSKNDVSVGTQPEINFIEGSNVTLTVTEDTINQRIDVEIASSGGGSGGHTIRDDGSDMTGRDNLNFVSSTTIDAIATDDAGNNETEVTFQRAALSGAIAASANSNATLFSGIRDNGATENDRTNLNFVPGTFITVAVTDDAGNDELEISYSLDTNSLLAAIASTSIVINSSTLERAALGGDVTAAQNSNTTAFRSFSAKSVLANATNSSAVPTELAGSAAFQHLRVNSANTALEWAVLAVTSPITLTSDNIGFDQTVNLNNNARVAVSKNSGATVGTRRRINFIEGTGVTLTIADDSGNEEVDVTIASSSGASGHVIRDNGSDETQRNALNFISSTSITAVATDDAVNNETEVTFQRAALTGDVTASANSNTTAFRSFSAKSVLANATNSGAVPSELAGSAAFQYLRVNSGNTGLEWAVLSVSSPITVSSGTIGFDLTAIDSTSIVVNSSTLERAALTGAIAASQNSNATVFSGIRDNGVAETARTNINVLSTTSIIAAIAQDAGNDEQEWTWQRAALTGDVTASQNSNTTAFRSFAAKSVLANATNGSAVPTELAGSGAFQYLGVNSANTALEWRTLSVHGSTSVVYSSNTFERAALTGAIAASQNSNATVFSGIRDNGASENDRTNLNFVSGAHTVATVTDDAGNDELEISFEVNEAANYTWTGSHAFAGSVAHTGSQTVAASGAFNVTLADTDTHLFLTTSGTAATLGTISGGFEGRMLYVEHFRSSGSADVTVSHVTGGCLCPDSTSFVLGNRHGFIARYRGDSWRVLSRTGDNYWTEVEETGAGPFNDYNAGVARNVHILASNAAGVFNGVVSAANAGDMLLISHQGSGYTECQHNNTSSGATTRFFNGALGRNIRIFDNQCALYIMGDATSGSGLSLRWLLVTFGNTADLDSTSITYDTATGTLQRAALTGAISASANSNSTEFSGIRINGALQTARGFINVLDTSTIAWTPNDDSANNENEWRANFRFGNIRDNGSLETARAILNFVNSTSNTLVVTDDSANDELEVTVQRAALSGAIVASANSNLTVFAGIQDNGSATTDRTNLNFIGFTIADDAGGDRINITAPTFSVPAWTHIEETTNSTTFNNFDTGGAQDIMFSGSSQVLTGVSSTGFSKGTMIAISNQGSTTLRINDGDVSSTDVNRLNTVQDKDLLLVDDEVSLWARLDVTAGATVGDRWMCVSHRPPFANCADNVDKHKIVHNGTDWFATKNLGKHTDHCEWWEDFECYENSNPEINTTSVPYLMGNTMWLARSGGSSTGDLTFIAGEINHPGILRMSTGSTSGTYVCIHRGSSTSNSAWVAGQNILDFEAVVRMVDISGGNAGFFIGFSEDPTSLAITGTGNSHICAFMYDTSNASLATSIRCITRESDGTATNTASGVIVGAGTWYKFRILQRTVGTIEFFINDNLVATHTTQVPDSELLNLGLTVVTRTTDVKDMDVDYVSFISQPLTRF